MAIRKKALKKEKPLVRSFSMGELGVLLESVDKNVKHVFEGHAVLDKKIDDFRHEVRTEIGFVKFGQRVHGNELSDLTAKLNRIEDKYDGKFDTVMKYLSEIDIEIQDVKKTLVNKADLNQVVVLEKQIAEIRLAANKHHGKN